MNKVRTAADTSALISLQLSEMLEESFRCLEYYIGKKILSELKEISKIKNALGDTADSIMDLVDDEVILVETREFEKGEKEALWIFREEKLDLLLSDDVKFVKSHREDASFSVVILPILIRKQIFSREEIIDRVNKFNEG